MWLLSRGLQHDLETPAWLFKRPQQGHLRQSSEHPARGSEDWVSKESLDQQSLKLETRRTELEALLASSKAPPPRLHPEMAGVYREQIFHLHEALNSELETQRQEAAEIVRSHSDDCVWNAKKRERWYAFTL